MRKELKKYLEKKEGKRESMREGRHRFENQPQKNDKKARGKQDRSRKHTKKYDIREIKRSRGRHRKKA